MRRARVVPVVPAVVTPRVVPVTYDASVPHPVVDTPTVDVATNIKTARRTVVPAAVKRSDAKARAAVRTVVKHDVDAFTLAEKARLLSPERMPHEGENAYADRLNHLVDLAQRGDVNHGDRFVDRSGDRPVMRFPDGTVVPLVIPQSAYRAASKSAQVSAAGVDWAPDVKRVRASDVAHVLGTAEAKAH